jgi:mannonate dehydratase
VSNVVEKFDEAGIKICHTVNWDEPDDYLRFLKQIGLRWVCLGLGEFDSMEPSYDALEKIQKRFNVFGLNIYSASYLLYRSLDIQLGRTGRDDAIEKYCRFIRSIGRLGIPVAPYDFHPANTYTTAMIETNRGYVARQFNLNVFRSKVEEQRYEREYSEEEMWANYTYFIERVLPVAEEVNVKLALHPDDPPLPLMNGVSKLFVDFSGYERAEKISRGSSNWGLRFCVGTWAEGGEAMGKDVFGMIRDFGQRGKLLEVHFRNVSSTLPVFHETLLDDGYLSMYKVMKTLWDVNFDGTLLPDHIPLLSGDDEKKRAGLAYLIAYMNALLRQVKEEG